MPSTEHAWKRKGTDSEAIAWSTALAARFAGADPKTALTQYQAALTRMPENAVVRNFVGDAYGRVGPQERENRLSGRSN